jgi:hypothetical protein
MAWWPQTLQCFAEAAGYIIYWLEGTTFPFCFDINALPRWPFEATTCSSQNIQLWPSLINEVGESEIVWNHSLHESGDKSLPNATWKEGPWKRAGRPSPDSSVSRWIVTDDTACHIAAVCRLWIAASNAARWSEARPQSSLYCLPCPPPLTELFFPWDAFRHQGWEHFRKGK